MTHWGWYWNVKNKNHVRKKLCSKLLCIDSFKVYRNQQPAGFSVEPLQIIAKPMANCLEISYRKQKKSPYKITIEQLPCNYGGVRTYFNCPACRVRMRKLYLAENSIFLCRKCLNLGYETQRIRPWLRHSNKSKIIKDIIAEKGGSDHKKPVRMWHKTFQRLKNHASYYEQKSHQALNTELRKWYGAKIEPYLDKWFDYVDEGLKC